MHKSFVCKQCDKKFQSKISLRRHALEVHHADKAMRSKRRHFCPLCPKDYDYKKQLDDHIRSFHEKERNAQCHICNKSKLNFIHNKHNLIHLLTKQLSTTVTSRNISNTFTETKTSHVKPAENFTRASKICACICAITYRQVSLARSLTAAKSFIRKFCGNITKKNIR